MKRIKMALMASCALVGIGSAFAFSPAAKHNAQTYYAEKSGSSFIWVTSKPARLSCLSTATNVTCTITTSTPPVNGEMPADQTVTNEVYR